MTRSNHGNPDDSTARTVRWSRDIPVRYEADVAVIGGGIAGVSAACAAARSGAKVILVERFGVTGGVLTASGVVNFCGQLQGQGEVFDTILADLRAFGALPPPAGPMHWVTSHRFPTTRSWRLSEARSSREERD
ncbi:MAG: FAD-dependent oxidoreductase [Lentisphaerae bacterium]|jgi:flavin-dependent dehydrogenase|nr:FAD-dependent oxidoreductase [Lentisphaerota bacterium]MBT4817601.1 FAD-dependent oxidoreductase [Lentisphaerota bacterium]MBT5612399.1 FAD-dependent oxidoreductase [Lentisphaerota bacterium]MBT7060425.1 FAD-dependent oxidoreductase [Lentisphaerota bacterium]MBT7844721.1 FAD-dependent oxidoreductase [Lentisphaerota bacterium]